MSTSSAYEPYCGNPPVPGQLLDSWNLDPVLLTILACVAALYAMGVSRTRNVTRRERAAFWIGWSVATAALVSPLCSLSVALFSARVGQHMVLTVVAAPLLILGGVGQIISEVTSGKGVLWPAIRAFIKAVGNWPIGLVSFAAFLWLWHVPVLYDSTLRSNTAYWIMHLSLFGSALLLWRELLQTGAERRLIGFGTGFLTSLHMGSLGALLTFAPSSIYTSHQPTTWPWGLSALADQQLGGLIMWVPGCIVFIMAGLFSLAAVLRNTQGECKLF
jgi:putative membrane protein